MSWGPLAATGLDTIIVSGGQLVTDRAAFDTIVDWLRSVRPRRLASVCSGAFLLAEAGRLDGRAATTHWDSTERFREAYPLVQLDPDRIYTHDGDVWTSAGISAGIDMALALIEDDYGPVLARRTAQQLVVHSRRPGGQSQFSGLLELGGSSGRFEQLVPLGLDLVERVFVAWAFHDTPPFIVAAAWPMARTIRAYVPQRHTLPCMAVTISSGVGPEFSASRATPSMIMPGVQ